jgi:hypothetical protein
MPIAFLFAFVSCLVPVAKVLRTLFTAVSLAHREHMT